MVSRLVSDLRVSGSVRALSLCPIWSESVSGSPVRPPRRAGTIPLLIGMIFEVTLVTTPTEWEELQLRSLSFVQDWMLGLVLLHLWAYLCAAGVLDGLRLAENNAGNGENLWQGRILGATNALKRGIDQGRWDLVTSKLLVRGRIHTASVSYSHGADRSLVQLDDLAIPVCAGILKAILVPVSLVVLLSAAMENLPKPLTLSFMAFLPLPLIQLESNITALNETDVMEGVNLLEADQDESFQVRECCASHLASISPVFCKLTIIFHAGVHAANLSLGGRHVFVGARCNPVYEPNSGLDIIGA